MNSRNFVLLALLLNLLYTPGAHARVSFQNSGTYVTRASVDAGSPIAIYSGFVASENVSGVKVRLEIRKVSESGTISSDALVVNEFPNESFVAGQPRTYKSSYLIPGTAGPGKYALAAFLESSTSGATLYSRTAVTSKNSFMVVNQQHAAYVRGINIMDMGIAPSALPGVHGVNYTRPTFASLQILKNRGLDVVRLPFLWERAQHALGGPLDPGYMGLLIQTLKDCRAAGLKAIVDMHNYARYTDDEGKKYFGAPGGPTREQYGDAWARISAFIRSDADAYHAVYAYDIMNEPHHPAGSSGLTGAQIWEQYAQAAVSAIRATGDTKLIHVEGYAFSSASRWPSQHATPFIVDPASNVMYQAHLYLDNDSSGTYSLAFDEEEALSIAQGHASVGARAVARLKNFSDWCTQFDQRCFLGEFGWPGAHFVGAADARKWNHAGDDLMSFMDAVEMGGTLWATGSWLTEDGNILNAYVLPRDGHSFKALSPSEVLENHRGRP
ncbi:glycoside hydrolase family 5 protein [Marilutibacter chinensis]|uniref:Glycoside hydrolase family 5 protein n=1 Tax=Marilutibacter chinensis TaxID=2912247 RepID=A0ABS9HUD5_9GAMM|nr:glycoside hydrolase family 5 protein [Lysobacter chinensis]MCF7222328.1 glycoside hydrolase family 5 protein [Lysobacter chinensis]